MKEKFRKPLTKFAWILFFLLMFLNLINWGFTIKDDVLQRRLPFRIRDGKAVDFADSTLVPVLENKTITHIDTLDITRFKQTPNTANGPNIVMFNMNETDDQIDAQNLGDAILQEIQSKKNVQITYQDSIGSRFVNVQTTGFVVWEEFINIGFNFIFLLFIFFNSYLLLKYSLHKENILIVYFLLLLSIPGNIGTISISNCLQASFTGLAAIFFYQYILEKVRPKYKIKGVYFSTLILIIFCFVGIGIISEYIYFLLFVWALVWMFISFFLLWKTYKVTGSIEFKRLLNAFNGILISIVALLVAILLGFILYVSSPTSGQFGVYTVQGSILAILILISVLIFLFGIMWFFGAFTWSLLTGTELGVKIRSTMIYTIVGVLFVVFFGLLDYSLGELLQTLFGRFMGSEFIAGIPATIGLLMFFNPVRQKVEKIVDNRLNTSDLDFLEKTETFADAITGESVIEGFEEYICENLRHRLPIKKVALISYDQDMKSYKFNEIRGSDVEENSRVEDVHLFLLENTMIRNYGALNENPQEIASFALIIPIIYDIDHKWFLALGAKNDGTTYSKRDEEALANLADRIRLSLKFILEYDKIIDNKINETIERKNRQIKALKQKIRELRSEK
ncbi:MAG: MFS transporter [Candidatus Cloacimonetes bacterium]|nr:MFS transporter [Candidatus Cloacimonadota bacterium]MCF7814321.1 MFS transporter [Candidatus Cloacimonadota bacterium]MCF7868398.1 MFS transporter [Candidatus Cloacimonadota bacterium]MCF7883837.1 MFS transporter [Candidatus Cloacimonadota bacterium]